MRRRWSPLLLLALLFTGFREGSLAQPVAPADSGKAQLDREAAAFFAGPVPTFELTIAPKFMDSLREDRRRPVPATVRVGTNVFESVAVHVKGAAGSTRSIDDRPALTLNFDKLKRGQTCFGLDKLHLNNSVQDRSLMDENLASRLYLAAGVPTARATHAFVKLNGDDLGLYVLKEGYDNLFIRRNFPSGTNGPGNLYDGGFVQDIDNRLELDAGKGPTNWSDLRRVVSVLELPPEQRRAQLAAVLDVDRFLSLVTFQMLLDDWDGYVRNRNNYRLYIDRAGRATFIPHGMDQLFRSTHGPVRDGWNGMAAHLVFELPELREQFRTRINEFATNRFTLPILTNHLAAIQGRIRAAFAGRPNRQLEYLEHEWRNYRYRVAERVEFIRDELAHWPEPQKPLAPGTVVAFGEWREMQQSGRARFDRNPPAEGGPASLHLRATQAGTIASFRANARMPAGRYRFSGRAQAKGIDPVRENLGTGAGLRISGSTRSQKLEGTTDWTPLTFDFSVIEDGEVELIIELRANRGEVWFDAESLKLVKL